MNGFQLVLLASCLVVSVFADLEEEWAKHQRTFPRTNTRNANEAQKRKAIFAESYANVQKHNAENHSYKIGLDKFSDWTKDEFKAILRNDNVPEPTLRSYIKPGTAAPTRTRSTGPLPASWDWREHGKVSPVVAQGGCSSCWAFGATAAIESMYLIKYNYDNKLSEQHLMDCTNITYGRPQTTCEYGGWPSWAYKFIIDNGGYALEAEYPYVERTQQCRSNPERFRFGDITGFVDTPPGDEEEMKRVVKEVGPMSVDVDASYFGGYKGVGIIENDNCGKDRGNHIVTIVGYGTENGKDYWIIKNSWGDWWGDKGFGKIRRGKNMCAISMHANYPIRE